MFRKTIQMTYSCSIMCFGGGEQSYTADARIKPLVAADQPRPCGTLAAFSPDH